MKEVSKKKITIKLPPGLANVVSAEEIVDMVMDKAVTIAEYYRSRCKEYEQKYGMRFKTFKTRVESAGTEHTPEWDDLLVWEGFELAYHEWKSKSEELQACGA